MIGKFIHTSCQKGSQSQTKIPGNWPGSSIIPENGISALKLSFSPRLKFMATDQVPSFREWHSTLVSDHVGNNPTVTSGWLSAHIWHGRNQSSHHDRMAQPLYLTSEGTNPSPCNNGSRTHHFPLEGIVIWRTPDFSLKYSKFTLANGLVNTSAICSSVTTY